jgi:small subunit ribosomal protein S5
MAQVYGQPSEYEETVIEIKRVAKKTQGGNTIRFTALVVVGDKKGKVGIALAKSLDVSSAIRKAIDAAKRKMIQIPIKGQTIPYSVREKYSAAKVIMKPAPPGSGIIAGGPIRVVLEAAGVRDAVGKILGTKNKASNVYATIRGLKTIARYDQRRKTLKK